MRKKILSILQYLLFLGLGIFLVWWSLHKIGDKGWIEFKQALKEARYWLVVPVALILIISHYFRTLRWKLLMEPMGYKPRTVNTFFAVLTGYLANLAVPRLGEVLKCTILGRYEKVPANKLIGTIVLERAVDFLTLIVVFFISLLLEYHTVGEYAFDMVKEVYQNKEGSFSFLRLGLLISVIILVVVTGRFIFRKFAHISFVEKVSNLLKGVWAGLSSVQHMKKRWLFTFYSILIWGCYLLGTYIGFFALADTSVVPFNAAFPVLAFASIGMILTPGGIGAYAFFLAAILELYNIPEPIGFANGTLQWFAQFIIALLNGFVALLILPLYNKKYSHA
ncbi:MAG TPA: lysylphosphatidylglycerol synthase transmembrane domain-containing protein [Chitinophagaceae bacterium]|nr:lysylphosphatidylglycerol synthase transmembrane domain-containing protein [Chitinophagaceae bacterium]